MKAIHSIALAVFGVLAAACFAFALLFPLYAIFFTLPMGQALGLGFMYLFMVSGIVTLVSIDMKDQTPQSKC